MVLVLEEGITQFGFVYYVYLFCSVSVYIANSNKKKEDSQQLLERRMKLQ